MPRRDRYDDSRPQQRGSLFWLWLVLGIGGVIVTCCGGGGIAFLWFGKTTVDQITKQEAERENARTYPTITAEAIVKEWAESPSAAASKYEKSGATIRGVLSDVSENWFLQGYVELDSEEPCFDASPIRPHIFFTSESAKASLRQFKVGDHVAVKCVATGQSQSSPWMNAVEVSRLDPPAGGWKKREWTRDEFKAMLMGKTEAEVLKLVGKPGKTSDVFGKSWTYYGATRDTVTNKKDFSSMLMFQGGKVASVDSF